MPETVTELSPEIIRKYINDLGYSIRKAFEEISISHSTLSRYINYKSKRQNKDKDKKMLFWLTMNS